MIKLKTLIKQEEQRWNFKWRAKYHNKVICEFVWKVKDVNNNEGNLKVYFVYKEDNNGKDVITVHMNTAGHTPRDFHAKLPIPFKGNKDKISIWKTKSQFDKEIIQNLNKGILYGGKAINLLIVKVYGKGVDTIITKWMDSGIWKLISLKKFKIN